MAQVLPQHNTAPALTLTLTQPQTRTPPPTLYSNPNPNCNPNPNSDPDPDPEPSPWHWLEQVLLEHGADACAHTTDKAEHTALHAAAGLNHMGIARLVHDTMTHHDASLPVYDCSPSIMI